MPKSFHYPHKSPSKQHAHPAHGSRHFTADVPGNVARTFIPSAPRDDASSAFTSETYDLTASGGSSASEMYERVTIGQKTMVRTTK